MRVPSSVVTLPVLIVLALARSPQINNLMFSELSMDKYGDAYGHAENIVANWGEPPPYSYHPWLGGIDDGGFFGLDKVVEGPRGIVHGFSATFSNRYEGRFVVINGQEPVSFLHLLDLTITTPMYGSFQLAKVKDKECQLLMIDRKHFEYIEGSLGEKLQKKKPHELRVHGDHVSVPGLSTSYEMDLRFDPAGNFLELGANQLKLPPRRIAIKNRSTSKLSYANIAFLIYGWKNIFLTFDDGSFAVLDGTA